MQVETQRATDRGVEQKAASQEEKKTGNGKKAAKAAAKAAEGAQISTYDYTVVNAKGARSSGRVRATSPEQAASLIEQPGVKITKLKRRSDVLHRDVGRRKIKRAELIIFSRQLATFVRAGVPILDALGAAGNENASRQLQDTLREMALDISRGAHLCDAMSKHPGVFPLFYVHLVRAGEITGRLEEALQNAAGYMHRQHEAVRKIRGALMYPAVIAVLSIAVTTLLVTFVVPRFEGFFDSFNAELPWLTRTVMSIAQTLSGIWIFLLGGIAAVAVVGFVLVRTERGGEIKDRILLALPGLGGVIRYSVIERFCFTLKAMIEAGVPLVTTFRVVIDGSKNAVFKKGLTEVRDKMLAGQGMSGPIAATGLFPPIVPQMMKVGENTGSLDNQLQMAADYFASELDERLKRFTALFEPIVLIVMGGVVGIVALAIMQAMYGIYSQVEF